MNNKFYFFIAFVVILVLGAGIYAYTFTTSFGTIGISEPTEDIATSNASATQPGWESILIPVFDTYNFRPNAAGDETSASIEQEPTTGEHWDKVSESVSDDDSTYVACNTATWREDLYNMTDHSTQTAAGTINYVDVYLESRVMADATQDSAYVHIKTNGVEYNGNSENLTTSYATYSYSWDYNPQTTAYWTWDEVDALQIGVGLQRPFTGEYARCTQVYAEVGFEAPPLTGTVPTGDLFEVTPNANYTGELLVNVYLLNTDNLTKAYNYLNMALYLEDSVEAGKTPDYQLLTLENGVVSFNIVDVLSSHTLSSESGGNYCLQSREPLEWETGWTVTPELYCEVMQR